MNFLKRRLIPLSPLITGSMDSSSYIPDPLIPSAPPLRIDSDFSFDNFPPNVPSLPGLATFVRKPDGTCIIIPDQPMTTYYSFPVQLIYSFGLGLIFAPLSSGFRYLIVFSVVSEIWYAYRIGGKYTPPQLLYRLGLFCVGLLGFLIGRWLIRDRYPMRPVYRKQICTSQLKEDASEIRREKERREK